MAPAIRQHVTPAFTLDLIIPVYRGFEETRRCIESVLANPTSTPREVVVVDDASPEPAIRAYLDDLAARSLVILLRNSVNQGFVASANRGMALHPDRDVLLLNSDAEVANDWLDRIRRCAYRQARVGTVTPFSNSATICSYPYEGWTGSVPGDLGLAGLDALIASANAGQTASLPTAVGFCMYIRRDCLDQVGCFDVERFGRGYGEENDFCMRASRLGWRHLLAADVFVYHRGGVSFSEERHALQQAAMDALLRAHPDFLDQVSGFHSRDPVAPLRAAIDRARLSRGDSEARQVQIEQAARGSVSAAARSVQLHVTHSWGGGVGRWVRDFCGADEARRNLVLRSQSNRNHAAWRLELMDPAIGDTPLLSWDLQRPIRATDAVHAEYRAILDGIIATFSVQTLVISSLIGHSLEAMDTGLPTVVTLHDLYPYCPALFACFGEPCTECPEDRLRSCLRTNSFNVFWHNTIAKDWLELRSSHGQRLMQPWLRLVAPTRSVAERWARLLPAVADRPVQCIGHGLDERELPRAVAIDSRSGSGRLRIVVPGRLALHKGLELFRQALPALRQHAEILLLGCGDFGRPFESMAGVTVIPHYEHSDLSAHIRRFDPDLALLLSVLPESFSYTLSEMMALSIPVVATRLGAFAERIDDGVSGFLIEPNGEALVSRVASLDADRSLLAGVRSHLSVRPGFDLTDMVKAYDHLLPVGAAASRSIGDVGLTEAAAARHELTLQVGQLHGANRLLTEAAQARDAEMIDLRQRFDRLSHEATRLDAERNALYRSSSWRITAPLRALVSAVRGLFAARPSLIAASAVAASCQGADAPAEQPDGAVAAPSPERGDRPELRRQLCYQLGVPDASRIVLGLGSPATQALAEQITRFVAAATAARNDICFVLMATAQEDHCWSSVSAEIGVMKSVRRLFFAGNQTSPAIAATVADGLMTYPTRPMVADHAPVALGAGLPVFALAQGALDENVPPSGRIVAIRDGDAGIRRAVDDLSACLDVGAGRIG